MYLNVQIFECRRKFSLNGFTLKQSSKKEMYFRDVWKFCFQKGEHKGGNCKLSVCVFGVNTREKGVSLIDMYYRYLLKYLKASLFENWFVSCLMRVWGYHLWGGMGSFTWWIDMMPLSVQTDVMMFTSPFNDLLNLLGWKNH